MPRIELIPEVYYQPTQPYHHEYDNLPLRNIITRQTLINLAVDDNSEILRDSIGSTGTLAARLNKSLNADGSLRTTEVDAALHNIAEHTDGSTTISGSPVNFVRMRETERDKLALIQDEANELNAQFVTPSTTVLFETGTLEFEPSSTVTWSITSPNVIKANMAFSSDAAHQHNYDLVPVHSSIGSPDYTNYKTTSVSTAFVEGSLRVYINGIRLSETAGVYVPDSTGPDGTWTSTYYTPSASAGTFALNRAITASDVIRIDFDVALA